MRERWNFSERASRELQEMGCKLQTAILLRDSQKKIQIPEPDEWVGLGLPERDDQLEVKRGS